MATFKKTLSGDSRYRIELKVEETNTNISNNTSDVDYELAAYKSSGSGYYTSSKTNPIKVVIDGGTIVNKNIAYDFRNTTKIVLASGTVRDIQHNADGTKTIQCSGYFKDNENSLGSATASGSLTLTQLHKAPEPYVATIQEGLGRLLSWGVNATTFVQNLSQKAFTFNANTYDDATVSQSNYSIKNGDISSVYSSLAGYHLLNFANKQLTITNNKVRLDLTATDSMNAVGTAIVEYENFILYTKPTLTTSNLKTPRDGQLTGKVKLIANGTYFNDVDNQFSQTLIPTLKYSIKEKGSNSYILQDQELTPIYSNGNWNIEANIGTDDTTATQPTSANPLFYFNPQTSYEIEVEIVDNLINGLNGITTAKGTSIVLVGEAIMTKYKDKVDFKKLTIKKHQILAPYELFDDTATTSDITLNDDLANYEYIEIFYLYSTNVSCFSQKVYQPDGKTIMLNSIYDNGTNIYFCTVPYTMSGTLLTRGNETRWRISTGGGDNTRTANTDNLRIYRVVGYK